MESKTLVELTQKENGLAEAGNIDIKTTKKKGKKKKGGSKKSNRQALALERNNKLAEVYKSDQKRYDLFVDRIDKWFSGNLAKITVMFTEMDKEGKGELTYDQFKAGMLDNNIPCDFVELHLLTRLLDTDGNLGIDFCEFEKGIKYFRVVEAESSPYRDTDTVVKLIDIAPKRWINCQVIMVLFEEISEHSSHFMAMINPDCYVTHLVHMIKEAKRLTTNHIHIYRNNSLEPQYLLDGNSTLEQCGFRGGDYYKPKDLRLFYDFNPDIPLCSLLTNEYF